MKIPQNFTLIRQNPFVGKAQKQKSPEVFLPRGLEDGDYLLSHNMQYHRRDEA